MLLMMVLPGPPLLLVCPDCRVLLFFYVPYRLTWICRLRRCEFEAARRSIGLATGEVLKLISKK